MKTIAKIQKTTEEEIICSALKRLLKEQFIDKKTVVLPENQYQALAELIDKPLTTKEIEGRKKLKETPNWDL